jgi:hypothetical protein
MSVSRKRWIGKKRVVEALTKRWIQTRGKSSMAGRVGKTRYILPRG